MKYLSKTILSIAFIASYICCTNQVPDLILINTTQTYPESDLRLSDVAEIKYIPLKFGPDSTIFVNPGTMSVAVFRDTIFVLNKKYPSTYQIILYDTLGNPLRKIDRIGRGPQEYLTLNSWTLDTLQREIFVWDNELSKLLVYDFNGEFKREKTLEHSGELLANLTSDHLVRYSTNSLLANPLSPEREGKVVKTKHRTITIIKKVDLEEKVYDFDYIKPCWTSNLVSNLSVVANGIYLTSDRSDTVYFLNKQLKLTPRIVDITPQPKRRNSAIRPSVETKRYIFLSNEYLAYYGEKELPAQQDYYVYDKTKKQIYQLKKNRALGNTVSDNKQQLFQDYIAIYQFVGTQNHNYAALFLAPGTLQENYDLLPPRLKIISDTLDDTDNPVLMLIKFK